MVSGHTLKIDKAGSGIGESSIATKSALALIVVGSALAMTPDSFGL